MAHHTNCLDWDYETHPNADQVGLRCAFVLRAFRAIPERFDRYGVSTVGGHKYIFKGMAPASCDYLVGHYRGSDFPCLQQYRVGVKADKRVGTEPKLVKKRVKEMETQLKAALDALDRFVKTPLASSNPGAVLAKVVSITCHFLTAFLTIHPYANGNGHMGRLLVWILLGRYNFWPVAWPLDERPDYAELLTMHRNGDPLPLNKFLMKCIIGQ